MSAEELTDVLTNRILNTQINFYVANFANCDMVGHTGNLAATIRAVSFIDGCISKIVAACLQQDAVLIITADHGNAEQMIDVKTGEIDKDHTTNPVPFMVIANELKFAESKDDRLISLAAQIPSGVISDVAPSILALFGLPKPPEMTGIDLLQEM